MHIPQKLKDRIIPSLAFLIYGICIVLLGYGTGRVDHLQLLALFSISFLITSYFYRSSVPLIYLLFGAVAVRIALTGMIPNLSDDIYRFIWDGNLLAEGIDPFAHVPSFYHETSNYPGGTSEALYLLLNSKDYFTVYPPFMQYVFYASAYIAGADILYNVIFMRSLIILSECAIIYILYKRDPANRGILLYAMNPAVIIEFVGNVHFESLMFLFLLSSVLLIPRDKFLAGLAFGFSVTTKLVPLIFSPIVLFGNRLRKSVPFFLGMGLVIVILSIPLISSELLNGMRESLSLYFQKFEFNASIYYVIREIGYLRKGYNDIAYIGPFLGWITFFVIVGLSWKFRRSTGHELLRNLGIALSAYLMLATTVHPWYVAVLTGLFVFSRLKYGFIWSFTALFSYMGYTNEGYDLPVFWILLEYLLVYFVLFWDISRNES